MCVVFFSLQDKILNGKGVKMMKNPIIHMFHEWLGKTGRSVLTVESYVADVKKYIAFLEAHEMEGSVTINDHTLPFQPL